MIFFLQYLNGFGQNFTHCHVGLFHCQVQNVLDDLLVFIQILHKFMDLRAQVSLQLNLNLVLTCN